MGTEEDARRAEERRAAQRERSRRFRERQRAASAGEQRTEGAQIYPEGIEGTLDVADDRLATFGSEVEFVTLGEGNNADASKGKDKTGGTGTRGPGRPKKSETISVDGLEDVLVFIHVGLAYITKTEEFNLEKDEAKQLAKAVFNVKRHYPNVPLPAIPASASDWLLLALTLRNIYGPRIVAMGLNRVAKGKGVGAKASPPPPTPQQGTEQQPAPFTPDVMGQVFGFPQ